MKHEIRSKKINGLLKTKHGTSIVWLAWGRQEAEIHTQIRDVWNNPTNQPQPPSSGYTWDCWIKWDVYKWFLHHQKSYDPIAGEFHGAGRELFYGWFSICCDVLLSIYYTSVQCTLFFFSNLQNWWQMLHKRLSVSSAVVNGDKYMPRVLGHLAKFMDPPPTNQPPTHHFIHADIFILLRRN